MNLYIFTDESGVFDVVHNDFFVFGGLIFLSKKDKDIATNKYIHAESKISSFYDKNCELKACKITNKDKGKLFRSLNKYIKFSVVIEQKKILKQIFNGKKSKQRYLDYAYKIMIKKTLQNLDNKKIISLDEIENINFYCDEHTTATDGKYELREGILEELKYGTFNLKYNKFFEPICNNLNDISLNFYDSKKNALIRAADIIANKVYYSYANNKFAENGINKKVNIIQLP